MKVKYASSVSVIILCRYLQLSSRHMRESTATVSKGKRRSTVNEQLINGMNSSSMVCFVKCPHATVKQYGTSMFLLNRIASKLLFGRYSYISIFLSPSIQHPSSLTRFQCWSFEITTSFMNSCRPCSEALSNLLTAISCPFGILPLYTGPKLPCPSRLDESKLSVAVTSIPKVEW